MHASMGMGLQFHDAMKCMGQGQGHLSERVRFGVSWITGTGRLGMDDTPMSCGLAGSALLLLQAFGGVVVVLFPSFSAYEADVSFLLLVDFLFE